MHLLSALGAITLLAAPSEAVRPGPIARGDDTEARALIGRRPPELPQLVWLDGRSRTLASLAGHVVVLRSFTSGCPFCASTMPTLERLHHELRDRGVVVLGVYHPKPPRAVTADEVAGHARRLGVSFPVAADPDWALVRRWWLDGADRHWTSVTWVLDRHGRIRHVHPGGEYHAGGGAEHGRCNDDAKTLRAAVLELLAEPRP